MTTDYTVGDTIHKCFTTRAFATGAPTTLLGTPVVSAYEDDSLTQITAGITLGVDHDGVTGLNLLTIVASGANGFETGKDYSLVITTGTVDSVSVVGEVVAEFTLGRSAAAVDLANGTDGLGAIKADSAAILVDTNELQADWTNGGRLDLIIDAVLVDTGTTLDDHLTDIKGTGFVKDTHSLVDIEGFVDLIDDGTSGLAKIATDAAAILADTGTDGVVVAAASKTGYRLSATGVDDVLDESYEGTTTLRQFLRLAASALFGKLAGAATASVTIRDEADTKDRIAATVDADGNRSAVTLDKT